MDRDARAELIAYKLECATNRAMAPSPRLALLEEIIMTKLSGGGDGKEVLFAHSFCGEIAAHERVRAHRRAIASHRPDVELLTTSSVRRDRSPLALVKTRDGVPTRSKS
jgi:hypothetical protein